MSSWRRSDLDPGPTALVFSAGPRLVIVERDGIVSDLSMVSALSRNRLVHAAVAAILLLLPSSAPAQQVGVKAGANFASLTPEEDEDPEISRRVGPIGGVWVRIAPSSRVSWQVEGLFSEKGVTFEPNEFGLNNPVDVRIRYIEIPVLARADVGAS